MTTELRRDANPPGPDALRTVVVRRTIPAPPRRVYAAWTDPTVAAQWAWGEEFDNLAVEMDARPGGGWRQSIRSRKTGKRWEFSGEFRELVPDERVVFTFAWTGDAGEVEGPSLVRVDLVPRDGATEVVITHRELLPEKAGETGAGWADCLLQVERAVT